VRAGSRSRPPRRPRLRRTTADRGFQHPLIKPDVRFSFIRLSDHHALRGMRGDAQAT
jgi:hypothetical protein